MYEKGFSYVLWINMRDITRNPNNPLLEDIVLNVLQKFKIDTSEMGEDIVEYLKRKLDMIVDDSKSALLIFDNADNLIQPEKDGSCQSSAFQKLCQLIRDTEGNVIRCIFTSRVCNSLLDNKHYKLELGYLSDADSRLLLVRGLQNLPFQYNDTVITDFAVIGHGLPYALELICSEAVEMDCEEMLTHFVNELKESPLDTLNDESRMTNLFDLSYQRLNDTEKAVFTSMAVFPSAFSYRYLSKVLKNLEGVPNLKPTILNKLKKHSLVSVDSGLYMIHPFLREFLKTTHWDAESCSKYEIAYYKTYINKLFNLARESLEMNKFSECIQEFQSEQQNFLHVLGEVGKGWTYSPPHIRQLMKEELLKHPTPDYITLLIFYYHEIYSADMIEFFKGCETFVEGQMKKNIWCCRFYIDLKSVEKRNDDVYSDLEPDEYGKAIVEIIKLSLSVGKCRRKDEFEEAISKLEKYRAWADTLNDSKMKAYFKCKILKTKVSLSKKACKLRDVEIDKNNLVGDLKEALDLCVSNFGLHGRTIDFHSQLGKLFWYLQDTDKAMASFDDAVNMAKSLAISHNKRHISCLLEKGRFLIDCKSKASIMEGKRLIEATLHQWKDFCGEFMWFYAMQSLLRVDRTRRDEVADKFLKEKRLFHPSLGAMHSAVIAQLDYSNEEVNEENFLQQEKLMLEKLLPVVDHLENLCQIGGYQHEKLLQDAVTNAYYWNMWIATRCMHALSESDAKQRASKALKLSTSHSFIRSDRNEELSFIVNCDRKKFVLLKKKCYIEQMGKRIPEKQDGLKKDLDNLLQDCRKDQDVWSWIIGGLARENRKLYGKVIPYLVDHLKPNENLLALVLQMFVDQIEDYKRESKERMTPEESIPAVKDMLRAITHVEDLLANRTTMKDDMSRALGDALKKWYTQLAFRTKDCFSRTSRTEYARKALSLLKEGDTAVTEKERSILKSLSGGLEWGGRSPPAKRYRGAVEYRKER